MKRILLCLCLALGCALALCACAAQPQPLPEGVTEEAALEAARTTVTQLTQGDYEALTATMDEAMQKFVKEQKFAQSWEAVRTGLGGYVAESKVQAVGQGGFAVVGVQVEYEKATLVYTLSYDKDLKLAGLYYK